MACSLHLLPMTPAFQIPIPFRKPIHPPPILHATSPLRPLDKAAVTKTIVTPCAHAAPSGKKRRANHAPTVQNRQARFRYEVIDTYECGIELLGTEVKAIREGRMTIRDGYGRVKDGQLFLHNVHIAEWSHTHRAFNHDPIRTRRLLLHKSVIRKLAVRQLDTRVTLIPLRCYFSKNGFLKVELALAKGKQLHDKRETVKKRDQDRDLKRAMKYVM